MKLAPSILTADWTRLGEEIRMAQDAGADLFHLDVMDGHFVPNITFGPLMVGAIRRVTELPLDCHLMISQPELYIGDFVRAGADSVTVHQEACVHLHRVVHLIKDSGCRASVALNFATPIGTLEDILGDLDQVLIMSVDPGFGGQAF
ncbi:MAG: ribulose-phosphate 3-epimerase, partial [Chloroflexota bacterium]